MGKVRRFYAFDPTCGPDRLQVNAEELFVWLEREGAGVLGFSSVAVRAGGKGRRITPSPCYDRVDVVS